MGGYPQVQVDVHVWDRIWVHVVWSGVSSAVFVSLSCVGGVRNVSIFRGKFAYYIFEGAWLRSTTKVNFDGNQAHRATQGILPPSKSLCHTGGVTRLGIYEVVVIGAQYLVCCSYVRWEFCCCCCCSCFSN